MKIAFVSTASAAETALARRMRYWSGLLAGREYEIRVFCPKWWDGESDDFEREGVTYRAVSESSRWFVARLPAALSAYRPDVIHAAGSEPTAALTARLSGTPVLVEWCGERSPKRFDRALSSADGVLVPSEHVRTKVRERGTEATVIPTGLPIEVVRRGEPAGSAGLIWSGRLDEHAGLSGLLLALAEFRDRDWRTLVIGDGPRRTEYEQLVKDLRIERRVDFVGELPLMKRIARLKSAHVFVHTADRCPFAKDLLLARTCGCVGIVEYKPDSAAHELIAGDDRGIGATDEEGIVAAIEHAGELPHEEYDERFEEFSHETVLERYFECCRAVSDQSDARLGDEPLR
jgi:glycosyltransferase involved in cell wall biosynthesis